MGKRRLNLWRACVFAGGPNVIPNFVLNTAFAFGVLFALRQLIPRARNWLSGIGASLREIPVVENFRDQAACYLNDEMPRAVCGTLLSTF